mgnify:CR=1 FL=1
MSEEYPQLSYPQLARAISVVNKLRDPNGGCPWDLKQTHKTLTEYLIEESYEFTYAVEKEDQEKMCEELGDVLLQILLHSQIASESNKFDIEKVAKTIADKMIHRHPHVFNANAGDEKLSAEQVRINWEQIKKKEKKDNTFFKEEDAYLPSLQAAQKIGKRSKRVNFDWDNVEQVFAKVTEEYEEVKTEFEKKDMKALREEIGDLLFSIVQFSRHLGFEAEEVLRDSNLKFINRFNNLENKAKERNLDLMQMEIPELEALWQEVKKELKSKSSN